jgi:hypothetical protein
MKILTDFHHHALLQSLILLFEKRLKNEIFRPIGLEWYEQGYWNVFPHPATAAQYLSKDQVYKPIDGTPPLNQIIEQEKGIYLCHDIGEEIPNKAIDFKKFKETQFDILIASLPQHIEPFKKLISFYQPRAKLIYQIGNAWNIPRNAVKNVMASAIVPDIPIQVNFVQYHQEFDLNTFYFTHPDPHSKKIYSFINCLNTVDLYKKDWELFLALEKLMPEWEFKSFGGQCRDGSINNNKVLADKTREATLIFHCKSEGDGMGHVIHNAAAVGRPLITRYSDYKGKLAEPLIQPYTAILVDQKTPEQIAQEIIQLDHIVNYGKSIHQMFIENVDFNREVEEIRLFLEHLQ